MKHKTCCRRSMRPEIPQVVLSQDKYGSVRIDLFNISICLRAHYAEDDLGEPEIIIYGQVDTFRDGKTIFSGSEDELVKALSPRDNGPIR